LIFCVVEQNVKRQRHLDGPIGQTSSPDKNNLYKRCG